MRLLLLQRIDLFEKFQLGFDNRLVIQRVQAIKTCSLRLELFQKGLVVRARCLVEVQVNGMQCECRNCRVWIAIGPGIVRGRVVDRENLNQLQPHLRRPIGQQFQIGKLADAKAFLTAQTKDRDGHARAFPGGGR